MYDLYVIIEALTPSGSRTRLIEVVVRFRRPPDNGSAGGLHLHGAGTRQQETNIRQRRQSDGDVRKQSGVAGIGIL